VGSHDLYDSGEWAVTSRKVGGLPTKGETLYVRLNTTSGKVTVHSDYSFTATTRAAMISPAAGSALGGSTVTFTWSAAAGASGYSLWLSSVGPGLDDLFDSKETNGTSATANGLPTNGETIYARLYTTWGNVTVYNDSTYTAATLPQAAMISPTPGSTLPCADVTFAWSAAAGASGYSLWLGSTGVGSHDLFAQSTTGTSASVDWMPYDGETVYVRLNINYSGTLRYIDYTYTAATCA
jgi:hypothetical protein